MLLQFRDRRPLVRRLFSVRRVDDPIYVLKND